MDGFEFTLNYKKPGYEQTIRKIYEEEYINQHIGGSSLAKKYNYQSFYEAFHKFGLPLRSNRDKTLKYTCDSHYFDVINTEEKAYWFGFISADGYITKARSGTNKRVGLSLNTEDKTHIEKFKNAINTNAPINDYEVKTSGYKIGAKYSRIIISDPILAEGLIKCGCIEDKTDRLLYPSLEILPKELEKHYIRGYFDGNGSIIKMSNKYTSWALSICSTEDVLLHIDQYMLDNGISNQLHVLSKRKPEHITMNLKIGGRGIVERFCDDIYGDATIYLDRKYQKYLQLKEEIKARERVA